MLVSLYTSRVVLSTLGVEDFGIYNVVGGVVAMFSFLNSTLASGTQRFLTLQLGKNDFVELKKTFSVSLNIHIALAVVIFILAETVGLWFLKYKMNIPADREYAALWVYQFSVFASILSIIQVPYNASIIAHEKMNIYAYVSILEVLLKLLIVYLLLISDYDKLIIYAILIFIVHIITITIYRVYCKKKYSECRFEIVHDKILYKSILTFSGWNVFGSGAVIGATQGVNILLNMFFGPAVNAAHGISFQVNSAITAFTNNFQTAVNPQIFKLYAAEKKEELYTLLFQNAKFSFCIMWLLILPIALKIDIILHLWLVEVPEYTALFCQLVLFQSLIFGTQRPFVMAVHAVGKMKLINLTSGIVLLLVLPISYLLLKMGVDAYVPFIVYICASLITSSLELFFLHRWMSLPILVLFRKVYIPIICIIICTLPFSLLIKYHTNDDFFSLLLFSGVSAFSVFVSVYYIAMSKNMRVKIINKVIKTLSITNRK